MEGEAMPIVNFQVGQRVFIIDQYQVMEGNITCFLNHKDVIVTSERLYFATKKKTYGIDFFFTREKAERVLEVQARQRESVRQAKVKGTEKEVALARNPICESCGLPIGSFGHCGCSY
jgi:hypothetical protein